MKVRLARAGVACGLTALLLVVLVMALVRWTDRAPAPRFQQVECTEDMACWSCEDMGNRRCGVVFP